MTSKIISHTREGCPAYLYCEALKARGAAPGVYEDCLFTDDAGCYQLTDAAERAIAQYGGDSIERDLIDDLVEQAKAHLVAYESESVDREAFDTLLSLHDGLFSSHRALWCSMVDSAQKGRTFTDVELCFYEKRIEEARTALRSGENAAGKQVRDTALAAYDRRLKEQYQLQFDDMMIADIDRMVGNIVNSRPTLIVGDKGIAKTQVAKFVMGLYGSDPIVVSVKGDMMSDELIGKIKHDRETNSFAFQEGILLTAMRKGLPVLLDEINFGDQAIIARLQDILIRRPGEAVFIQESGEEPITIHPGFMVFATANEASLRYRHREILDPAIRDRFDIVVRSYPDLENDPLIDTPDTLMRLATSSAVDTRGVFSRHIDQNFFDTFVRLAYITQYLYAVPAKDVGIEFTEDRLTSVVMEESQPLMTDCITPRTMSKVVADCAAGNLPGKRLDEKLLETLLRSLDQAGSTHNYELAAQVKTMLGVGIDSEAGIEDAGVQRRAV